MGVAQMNIRLDEAVKASGDRGVAAAGYTSTEAIRIIWGFAAANEKRPEIIRATLEDLQGRDEETADRQARRLEALEHMSDIDSRLRMLVGGHELPTLPEESTPDFRERALVERMTEKGLW